MSVSNQIGFGGFPVPIGTIIAYAGSVIPPNYLICDGAPVPAQYPYLAFLMNQIYGFTSVPDLSQANGQFIGGGSTPTEINLQPGIITNPQASFEIGVANMPEFSSSTVTFSGSGNLNGTGQSNTSTVKTLASGSPNVQVAHSSNSYTSNMNVALTTFVADLVAHAQDPVTASVVTITDIQPESLELNYIIKAGY